MDKKMTKKAERVIEAQARSNCTTNKMTAAFFALVALVTFLIYLNNNSAFEAKFLLYALPWVQLASGILLIGALVYHIFCKYRGHDEHLRVFSSAFLLGNAAVLFGIAMLYIHLGAFRAVIMALAAALLFFVYKIYSVDFFLFSIAMVFGAVAVSFVGSASFGVGRVTELNIVLSVLVLVVSVLCSLFIFMLNKKRGFKIRGRKILMPFDAKPLTVYAGSAAALAAVIFAVAFGHVMYVVAALCAIYLIVAIIYTVKMM